MDGILLVDKPKGKTSHDVVDSVRRELGERSVGHAGTLDPLATGLLVLGVGKATRLLEYMQYDKAYEADVELGILTETDDADGARIEERPVPSRAELEAAAAKLRGEIVQTPPRARFLVRGSKGLYIRAIARDLGGHVTALRRTACGPFRVEDAGSELLPVDVGLMHLPEVRLSPSELHDFENGRFVPREVGGIVRVYCGPRFVGIGEQSGGGMKPRKVIQT